MGTQAAKSNEWEFFSMQARDRALECKMSTTLRTRSNRKQVLEIKRFMTMRQFQHGSVENECVMWHVLQSILPSFRKGPHLLRFNVS